jgi:hypothetical protein
MVKYYKILSEDLTHYGFKYQLGLNVDKLPFTPRGYGLPGGLYYSDLDHVFEYLDHGTLIAEVEPVGAIHKRGLKWKTDKLMVHSMTPLIEWFASQTEEQKLKALKQNPNCIKYIPNPTEEMKFLAVKQNGLAIMYIVDPSEELKLAAVKQNGSTLSYMKNPSEDIQLAAVKNNGKVIQLLKNPSEKVQLAAVNQHYEAIKYIENPSEEVMLSAIKHNNFAFWLITSLTPEERIALWERIKI